MSFEQKKCAGGIYFSRIAYIREKKGKEGMQKILKIMKKMGYDGPTDESEIKIAKMYPMEYNIMFLKAFRELYGERDFRRMARETPKKKGFVGLFLKWAGNPEMLIKKSGEYWSKLYNFGKLEGKMIGEKRAVITGHDVSPDPIFCDFLTDYFVGVIENTGVKNIGSMHTRCVHRGDDVCEWEISWGEEKASVQSVKKEIRWDDSLETGVDEIDRQHRYFIKIVNELNQSVSKNYRTSILRALSFMDRYAHWHFASEEKYMKKYNYPEYEYHHREHEKFYAYTEEIRRRAKDGEIDASFAFSVNKYLIEWLINHIKGTDVRFAEFLRVRNLEMQEEEMLLKDMEEFLKGL